MTLRSKSCTLEVDLEYTEELHNLHNDYPLAPENVFVNVVSKVIPNLNNKTQYLVHYTVLQFYLKHCLRLTKIHRPWMKNQICITFAWCKPVANFDFA